MCTQDDTTRGSDYLGYRPVCANDFIVRSHLVNRLQYDPKELALIKRKSHRLAIFVTLLTLVFIFLFVWQFLVASCRVPALCEVGDVSSERNSVYRFRTFHFEIQYALIWIGLSVGSFSLCVVALFVLTSLKMSSIPDKILYIVALLKQASSVTLVYQYVLVILPSVLFIIVVGVAVNWTTAGAFAMGSMITILSSHIASSLSAKGTAILADSSRFQKETKLHMIFLASRWASFIHFSTIAAANLAASAVYLVYADVRSLAGYLAGSSVSTLVIRFSTSVIFDANVTAFNLNPQFRLIPPNIISVVSAGLGKINGFAVDRFDSLSTCVIATAIAGSSLPFFSDHQYANCIFNHLSIDQKCGPFGYPQALSYAAFICRADGLYTKYPLLNTWSSVSIFVAAPFVLTAASTLVSLLCIAFSFASQESKEEHGESISVIHVFMKRIKVVSLLSAMLLTVSSLAVCFGLFGPTSSFQSHIGFGSSDNLPQMILDGSFTQCFRDSGVDSRAYIPQGAQFIDGKYRPYLVSSGKVGSVGSTATRLFVCNFLGIVLATVVSLFSSVQCVSHTCNDRRLNVAAIVARRMVSIVLFHISVTVLMIGLLVLSFALYGAYGVGFAALGYNSASTLPSISLMTGRLLTSSASVEKVNLVAHQNQGQKQTQAEREVISCKVNRIGMWSSQIAYNVGAFFSTVTALFVVVYQAGIWASPRDLVGSPDIPAGRLISTVEELGISDVLVLVGLLLGGIVPFLLCALFVISVQIVSMGTYVQNRVHALTRMQYWPTLIGRLARMLCLQSSILMLVTICGSVVLGFGLGSRAMVGALTSSTVVGYVMGTIAISGSVECETGVRPNAVRNRRDPSLVKVCKTGMGLVSRVCMKTWVSMGLMMATAMEKGVDRGWIGLILLLVSTGFVAMVGLWNHRQYIKLMEAACVCDQYELCGDPIKGISPFYEEGSTLLVNRVKVDSEMGAAIKLFGNPSGAVSPGRAAIPRAPVKENEAEDAIVPRQLMAIAPGIRLDEARPQAST